MLVWTDLNIRMADYDGGMREHIPSGPESKKKGQKDEKRLELKATGPALNITHSKHPGLWNNSASVNSAIKIVKVFGSPSFSSQRKIWE